MTKILSLLLRALLLLTMAYSFKAIAADASAVKPAEATNETQAKVESNSHRPSFSRDSSSALANIPPEVLASLSGDDLADILQAQISRPKTAVEAIFDKQIIVPTMVFGSFAAIAFFIAYFSFRKRRELLLLVQDAIKSGHTLPDSFLESLEQKRKPTAEADLRKALILIALGLSSIVIVCIVADPMERKMASLGVLPLLVGFAYLFLYKNAQSKSSIALKRID